MAVIRDVTLDNRNDNIIFIGTISGLCLIVAVIGIKLKWFKHRMSLNDLPTTTVITNQSNGMEPQIIRATFRPRSDFDNYVEVTPPKVLPPVRIHKSTKNTISLPPRKRQAPDVPAVKISNSETIEIETLPYNNSNEHTTNNLNVEERRQSTPPPPLPLSEPPCNNLESFIPSLELDDNFSRRENVANVEWKLEVVPKLELKLEDEPKFYLKSKDLTKINEKIRQAPPAYQENDPHNHYKKFTKKKSSRTPLPSLQKSDVFEHTITESLPSTANQSLDSTSSPKDGKLDKKQSFLHQVQTPTEVPKLLFDFPPSVLSDYSSEPLLKTTTFNNSLEYPQKINEKKGFFGLFAMKLGSKTENDVNKIQNEKKDLAKTETKTVKPIVKKVRILKTKKEVASKVNDINNVRIASLSVPREEPPRKSEQTVKLDLSTANDLNKQNMQIIENVMEIDYFQKVKKAKPNRVPVIIKSPKPERKCEEKPTINEVFRHEETFSAANGPIKVKKKKSQLQEGIGIGAESKLIKEVSPTHLQKSSRKLKEVLSIPKPRPILQLDGADSSSEIEIGRKPKRNVDTASPSPPGDTEINAWNLVAQHRINTRAMTATEFAVRQKSDSDVIQNYSTLQIKQINILNKPKTMREMKREQEERREKLLNRGDEHSDTEA